ncbi:MAG: MbcA/ParS/Xre antitoxin family protein [Hydrogenophaga sp.]|uniref:MbcA/ParS/Xre antitoxin family protein n=2 Tax=Hydrogenophaga sp. TaxID=1904254 RepID=UPI002733A76C|nr:MbcA/ParS/Xre antitoxin family protein [Hydrogenophaga sp.]MDP3348235.1 MbcA/ParS/Xre antitoxin family protein [Hydrogenophaga sp.]
MPEYWTNARPCQPDVEQMATDTFETEQDAAEWLSRPHPMLDHETPLQTAQTEAGAHRVKALLVAIKYGGVI